jgi:hypothetical protein
MPVVTEDHLVLIIVAVALIAGCLGLLAGLTLRRS